MNKTKVFVRESPSMFLNEGEDLNTIVTNQVAELVCSFSEAIAHRWTYGDASKFSSFQLDFSIARSGRDFKVVMRCYGLPSIPVSSGGVGMPPLTKNVKSRKSKR